MSYIIIVIVLICIAAIASADGTPLRKTVYDADFSPATDLLSRRNKGFCLNGKQSLTIEDSFKNLIVYGGSGAGKSSVILVPAILKMIEHSSLIINDPAIELRAITGGYVNKHTEIKILDYSRPEISVKYNPLKRIASVSDIKKITKLISVNALGTKGNDPFWTMSAESLIQLFIRYTLAYTPAEYHTLYNVLHLINTFAYNPSLVDKLFIHTNDVQLISEYKAFVSYGDKTLMSIVATCRAALSIFNDPAIAAVTSSDTLSIESFRAKPIALYINNSVKDMKYYAVITALFFEQLFGEIMTRIPAKTERPIYFLIDEASSLYISSIQTAVSNIRKFRSGIMQVYQDYNQVINLYGLAEAKAINANAYAKCYMPGVPIDVAEQLSVSLGKFQYVDEDGVQHVRPLLTPDEVRQLDEALIFCGNKPAIKTKLYPYYQQYWLNRKCTKYFYEPLSNGTFQTPPLIQIN
jgi:type IV secretion system protein VirD4